MVVRVQRHLEIEPDELSQVTVRVRVLRAEHCTPFGTQQSQSHSQCALPTKYGHRLHQRAAHTSHTRSYREHALKVRSDRHLLVELRRLCQIRGRLEVLDLK